MPRYEEDEARLGAGYKLREWRGLDWSERAREVAHLRARHLVALHTADAQEQQAERDRQRE